MIVGDGWAQRGGWAPVYLLMLWFGGQGLSAVKVGPHMYASRLYSVIR